MADDTSTTTTDDGGAATATDDTATAPAELGDAGKKALQEERRKARDAQKQLNEALAQLKEFQDRDKSEAEKTAERLAAAEKTAAEAVARAMRRDIALEHKLTTDDAALLDAVTDEDAMRHLAERLAKQATDDTTNGAYVPSEGRTSGKPAALNSDQLEQALRAKLGV